MSIIKVMDLHIKAQEKKERMSTIYGRKKEPNDRNRNNANYGEYRIWFP